MGPVREPRRIFITESQVPTVRIFLVSTTNAGSVVRSGPEPSVLLAGASTIEHNGQVLRYAKDLERHNTRRDCFPYY